MARAIWSGSISFGLVTVPVKMYTAIRQKDVSFHQVDKRSGARVKYKRVSAKTGREVPLDEIAKGYEVERDRYVVIDPEEIEALDPKTTHTIDIEDFVAIDEIDPIYYERAYYLAPDKGGAKAYALLLKAMEESNRIGIGRVVMRTKQYLAAIRPYEGALALSTMLYPDEVVPLDSIDAIPDKRERVDARELKMAKQLIESLASEFDPERYQDEYRKRVLSLIKDKAKGKTVEIEEGVADTPKVLDLMEALRASVEGTESAESKPRKRKTQRRRKSA